MGNMKDIATTIEQMFTPFAFTCECDEPSCVKIRETDRYAIGQYHTVQRIAEYLRSL